MISHTSIQWFIYSIATTPICSALSLSHLCNPTRNPLRGSLTLRLPQLCAPSNHTTPISNLGMMYGNPPFALFSLVDLSTETIDAILEESFYGSTTDDWLFYLVTGPYSSAPKPHPPYTGIPHDIPGTIPPIPPTFRSPFIGQDEMAAAEWIKKKPSSVNVDSFFFALLDYEVEKTGSVVVCRIGNGPGGPSEYLPVLDPDTVQCMLWAAKGAGLFFAGMDAFEWEQQLEGKGEYYPDV